jgi:D-alanyl-D-alanine carboxypeptidase
LIDPDGGGWYIFNEEAGNMSKSRIALRIMGSILLVCLLVILVYAVKMNAAAQAEAAQAAAATPSSPSPSPSPTPEPSPTPTPGPYADKPDVDTTSWEFLLANPENSIGDYSPTLGTIEGQKLDARIVDAMTKFVAAARAQGLSVYLSSGYRSYDEQSYLYNRKVGQVGETEAAKIVAKPGTSEHETGLACDITDKYYESKDESLEKTALYQWMSKHCQEYGFIVRYPKDKEDVTGIIYEPWHFRYVGVEAATYIMDKGLCLEEFLDLYK